MPREYFLRADEFPTLTVLVSAPETLAGQTWRGVLPLAGLALDGRADQDAIVSAVLAAQFGGAEVPADVSVKLLANAHGADWDGDFDPRQTPIGSIGFELEFGNDFAGMDDMPLVFTVAGKASDAPALADIVLPAIATNETDIALKDIQGGAVGSFFEVVPCCALPLTTISGQETIVGLAIGDYEIITVDHSADADFAFCEDPRLTVPEGIIVTVLAARENADATSGAQFILKIENESHADSYGNPTDIVIDWTRVGVLA